MADQKFVGLNTPNWLLDIVRKLDPKGQIGLDPCSNRFSMVRARTAYDEVSNGLIHSWRRHGLVFMNPPHSMSPNNIEPWMEKAHQQFIETTMNNTRDQFVGLVPAKTGPEWFHRHACHFTAKCFLKGRIKFWQDGMELEGPGKFDSLVLYHGRCSGTFIRLFKPLGWCVWV